MDTEELKKAIEKEQQSRDSLQIKITSLLSSLDVWKRWLREEQTEIKANRDIIAMLRDVDKQKTDALIEATASLEKTVLRRQEEIKAKEDMVAMLNDMDTQKREMIDQLEKELRDPPAEEGAVAKSN